MLIRLTSILLSIILVVASSTGVGAAPTFPNDPQFLNQWALHNTGQNGGKIGADMHVLEAWNVSRCSPDVTIAILDSGVDTHHADLASKLVPGAAFYPGVTSTSDDLGHGTQVAGVAAAATNNGEGIAGICPDGKIMPVKVVNSGGHTNDPMVGAGIKWAVDHGAKVISMSFWTDDIPEMRDAVAYAYAHNVVVVAAYGGMPYPADYPHVIAVGGSDNQDHAVSTQAQDSHNFVLAPDDGVITTNMGGGYGTFCTCVSIAAPEVAGVVALLLSAAPELTPDEVLDALAKGADPADGQTGFNAIDGYGRVNAYRSLQVVQHTMPLVIAASLKHATLRIGHKQTLMLRTLPGASVTVIAKYQGGKSSFGGRVTPDGTYSHAWKAPNHTGAVTVAIHVTDINSRSKKMSLRFTIR